MLSPPELILTELLGARYVFESKVETSSGPIRSSMTKALSLFTIASIQVSMMVIVKVVSLFV